MTPFYWPVGRPDPKPQKSLHSLPNPDEALTKLPATRYTSKILAGDLWALYERIK